MQKEINQPIQVEDPDWKKLEKVIADIQQVLAPGAKVTHNDKIIGKSGEPRKIDVSIRENIGINPILIVIDCKHHTEPIGRKDVAGFAEQVDDVGPCIGIMVSSHKYGRGAIQVAKKCNIILKTFTEANETDWKQLFGSHPILYLTAGEWTIHKAWMPESRVGGVISQNLVQLDPGSTIFTGDLQYHPVNPAGCVVGDLFAAYYEELPRPRPIGQFRMRIPQINPPYYIYFSDKQLISPPYLLVEGTIAHKRYPITYEMAKGHALKSDLDKVEAIKVVTKDFTLIELTEGQEGIPLTKEEWENQERVNLAEFRAGDNHLFSLEFVAAPPKK